MTKKIHEKIICLKWSNMPKGMIFGKGFPEWATFWFSNTKSNPWDLLHRDFWSEWWGNMTFWQVSKIIDNFEFFENFYNNMDNFEIFWQLWFFIFFLTIFDHFDNCKDFPGDLWHLKHWLQFWHWRSWIHDNNCYLTFNKNDSGQHS